MGHECRAGALPNHDPRWDSTGCLLCAPNEWDSADHGSCGQYDGTGQAHRTDLSGETFESMTLCSYLLLRSSTPGWMPTCRVSLRRPTPKQAMSRALEGRRCAPTLSPTLRHRKPPPRRPSVARRTAAQRSTSQAGGRARERVGRPTQKTGIVSCVLSVSPIWWRVE